MIVDPNKLDRILKTALKWVPAKPVIVATGGFLLHFGDEWMCISATDAQGGSASLILECEGGGDETMIVDAKSLTKIVSTMARVGNPLEITVDRDSMKLMCGQHITTVRAIGDPDDFPHMAEVGNCQQFTVDAQELSETINVVREAANPDTPRPALSGIHFHKGNAVSADGWRIIIKSGIGFDIDPGVTIYADSCKNVMTALSGFDGDAVLSIGEDRAAVEWDRGKILTVTVNKAFPSYEQVIPIKHSIEVTVSRKDLIMAADLSRGFSQAVEGLMILTFEDSHLMLEAISHDGSNMSIVEYSNVENLQKLRTGIHYQFLMDAVRHIRKDVVIRARDEKGMITVTDGDAYAHHIMPMYIREA